MDLCIVLDQSGDESELEGDGQMTDLLTALHLSVMLLDLKIRQYFVRFQKIKSIS